MKRLLFGAIVLVACNGRVEPVRSPPALLACERGSDCSSLGATCGSAKLCEDTSFANSADVIMVVDIPENSYAGSGATLLLPRSEWRFETSTNCKESRCMRLPRVVRARTRLTVGDELSALVGLETEAGAVVASDVSYVPRIRITGGGKAYVYDAMALGLPTGPMRTTPLSPKTQGLRGIFGTKATDALAYLPTNGVYARRVTPALWLSALIPPLQDVIVDVSALDDDGVATLAVGGSGLHLEGPITFPLHYDRTWSGGVHVSLREASTGAILSTTASVPPCFDQTGCDAQVELRSIAGIVAGSLLSELRMEPSTPHAGLQLRYHVYNALGTLASVTLPSIQAYATLQIAVQGVSQDNVPARVSLRSVPSVNAAGVSGVEVRADLARGQNEILVPVGTYAWRAVPEDGVHGAATGLLSIAASGALVSLQVAPKPVIYGQLLDPTGAAIAGAAVSLNERAGAQLETSQLTTDVTAADGRFTLRADSGSYALRVRAPDWTALGEARLNDVLVSSEGTQQLGALRMGVPRREFLRLFDADELLVSKAGMLVRLYQRLDNAEGVHFEAVAFARTNDEGAVSLKWSTLRR